MLRQQAAAAAARLSSVCHRVCASLLSGVASAFPPPPPPLLSLTAHAAAEIASIKASGLYKSERVLTSPQGAHVTSSAAPGRDLINLCSNNYLGLATHPAVEAAAAAALSSRGFGLASVRFICGTQDVHKELEAAVARFHGTEDAILFPSCFDANAGVFEALLGREDAVISDSLNHASIIDGIRLCKAQRYVYKHLDMADLAAQLEAASHAGARLKLIVTDGAFSMDGDIAPLREIVRLARAHGAATFIDECHATGFLGPTGRGTDEYWGLRGQIDVINSTLGKALGGATGGYTAASAPVVDLLRQRARPYLFSNTLTPSVAAASLVVFDLLQRDATRVLALRALTHHFRSRMAAAGFTLLGHADHPIAPVLLGDARLAAAFAEQMLARGIYVVAFSYPVVPRDKARIRTQMSAAHSQADIDAAVDAFIDVGRKLGVVA